MALIKRLENSIKIEQNDDSIEFCKNNGKNEILMEMYEDGGYINAKFILGKDDVLELITFLQQLG